MKKALLLSVVLFVTCQFSPAQDQPRWELFGATNTRALIPMMCRNHWIYRPVRLAFPAQSGEPSPPNGWNVSLQETH